MFLFSIAFGVNLFHLNFVERFFDVMVKNENKKIAKQLSSYNKTYNIN